MDLTHDAPTPALARVRREGQPGQEALESNSTGKFPRLFVKPGETLDVVVAYPRGHMGEVVAVQVLDGGRLGGGLPAAPLLIGEDKSIRFNYTVSANDGIHRISLQRATETHTLDFWAGPDNVYRTLSKPSK